VVKTPDYLFILLIPLFTTTTILFSVRLLFILTITFDQAIPHPIVLRLDDSIVPFTVYRRYHSVFFPRLPRRWPMTTFQYRQVTGVVPHFPFPTTDPTPTEVPLTLFLMGR